MGVDRVVPAEVLRVQAKPFGRDIQRGEVERLELLLVGWRVDVGQLDRRIDIELDYSLLADLDILAKLVSPGEVLITDAVPVVMPLFPALDAIDRVHVLVRDRVIRRHRRTIRIVIVVVTTARIHLDAVVRGGPAGIVVSLRDHVVGIAIGLQPVMGPRTAAGNKNGCQ